MSDDHGYALYSSHPGCRCDVCRKAKADYQRAKRAQARMLAARYTVRRELRQSVVGRPRYLAPGVTHGLYASYTEAGCRCWDCTSAATVKRKAEQARTRARRRVATT